jgi:N-methylhydantoinase A
MGWMDAPVVRFEALSPDAPVTGPAIVESSFTTVVIDPWATAARTEGAGLRVTF